MFFDMGLQKHLHSFAVLCFDMFDMIHESYDTRLFSRDALKSHIEAQDYLNGSVCKNLSSDLNQCSL